MKRRKTVEPPARPAGEVVRLEDLAPRDDVSGGSGKLRFGERRPRPGEPPPDEARRRPRN